MPTIRTQVLGVSQRTVGDNKTIYDVKLGDGNTYSTFDASIKDKAIGVVGIGDVDVEVNIKTAPGKRGGMFTNYYIEDVRLLETVSIGGERISPAVIAGDHNPPQRAMVLAGEAPAPQQSGMSKEREERITRMNVLGTAFKFYGDLFAGTGLEANPVDTVGSALGLAARLYDIAMHGPITVTTPQEAASAVNGMAGAEVVKTGAQVDW